MTTAPGDPAKCPLCGGENRCALAARTNPDDPAEREPECWCVSRSFPKALTDGVDPTACICARCLDDPGAT